jgi:hypothetical protein
MWRISRGAGEDGGSGATTVLIRQRAGPASLAGRRAGEAAGAEQQTQASQKGGQSPPGSSPGHVSRHRSEGAAETSPVACRRHRIIASTAIDRIIRVIYNTKPRAGNRRVIS